MGWVGAGDGYEVALEGGKVVCRNAKGRMLRSVPPKLADDPAVAGLRQLAEWLERHERECLAAVERWMVRSLPVPAALITRVWADEAWRAVLRDTVVTTGSGATGFLRDADPERGVGLVDLDGDTVRTTADSLHIPHPVLLDDLEDLRDFAVELGVDQRVSQLYREVWQRPDTANAGTARVDEFSGGRFPQLRFLLARATQLGYQVRGGQAVCTVVEDGGRVTEARVYLGDFDPYSETETGSLAWTDQQGHGLQIGEIGRVAWSEGMRMAAALHAGRTVDNNEGAAA